jgi:hypothetical protein
MAYSFYDLYQYYLNNLQYPTGQEIESLAPIASQTIINQNAGGGDEYKGGGKFGNLDLSRSKTFTKDVFDEEMGDFVPTELTAYYNPTLGNYQTFEGKNVNPMFSNTGMVPGIIGVATNLMGFKPATVGGYVPGSIRGYYDGIGSLFARDRNEQTRTTAQIAASKQADVARADALRAIRDTGGGGGDNRPSPSPARTSQGVTSAQHSAFRN